MRDSQDNIRRIALISIAFIAIALGLIGIILPLLPTVPFLLLASYCLAKSSPRLQQKLLSHPRLGPLILQYQNGQGIPRKIKILACMSLFFSLTITAIIIGSIPIAALLYCLGTLPCIYIWRQKDAPEP